MKADEIISALQQNSSEHYTESQIQESMEFPGAQIRAELSSIESISHISALSSLGPEELMAAYDLTGKHNMDAGLRGRIEYLLTPRTKEIPKRNESITTLLKWFTDRKSGKVVAARKKLKDRFQAQSYMDQKRIVAAFLDSANASDRDWAALIADRQWDESYSEHLKRAWGIRQTSTVAKTVIRHLETDFIKANISALAELSCVDVCIRLGRNPEFDIRDYHLDTPDFLYVMAVLGRPLEESESDIEKMFFEYIYTCSSAGGLFYSTTFDNFPKLRRAIWALGQHKLPGIILRFLEMYRYVDQNNLAGAEGYELVRALTRQWIAERYPVPEIDDDIEEGDSIPDDFDDSPFGNDF